MYRRWKCECAPVSRSIFEPTCIFSLLAPFPKSRRFLTLINAFLRHRRKKAWDGKKFETGGHIFYSGQFIKRGLGNVMIFNLKVETVAGTLGEHYDKSAVVNWSVNVILVSQKSTSPDQWGLNLEMLLMFRTFWPNLKFTASSAKSKFFPTAAKKSELKGIIWRRNYYHS